MTSIFSDFTLPSYDGESALKLVTEKGIDTPFIYVRGTIGEGPAIYSLLHGCNGLCSQGDALPTCSIGSSEHCGNLKSTQSA